MQFPFVMNKLLILIGQPLFPSPYQSYFFFQVWIHWQTISQV